MPHPTYAPKRQGLTIPASPAQGEGFNESPVRGEDARAVARRPLPVQLTPFSPAAQEVA